MKADPAAILAQTHFFRELSEAARRRLAELCSVRSMARGEVLFREGDAGEGMYVCNRGRVRLLKRGPDGRPTLLRMIRPGEAFAEVVLFEQPRYPVTAVAAEAGSVMWIPRREMRALLREEPFRDEFVAMLLRKLRYLAERAPWLSGADVEERLWRFLDEQFGDAPRVTTGLRKRDVAEAIGVTPETLSRLLARLEAHRRLRWRAGLIERPAPPRACRRTGSRR